MKKSLFLLVAGIAAMAVAALAHAAGVPIAQHLAAPDLTNHLASPGTAISLAGLGLGGMLNYVQDGKVLDLDPGATVPAGTGCLFGQALFGVAAVNGVAGTKSPFITSGVVDIAKTAGLAVSVGDRLYWDATNKVVNKTATAQQEVGVCVQAAQTTDGTVRMKLGAYLANAA